MDKKEYIVFAMTSSITGVRMEEPRAVHQNLARCKHVVTRYTYSEAVRLAPKLQLARCGQCKDYHT